MAEPKTEVPLPRVAIIVNEHGELVRMLSDVPLQLYTIAPHCPIDRIYQHSVEFVESGPNLIDNEISAHPVGHIDDGALVDAIQDSGHRRARNIEARKRSLKVVSDNDD